MRLPEGTIAVALVIALQVVAAHVPFQTNWDKPFLFECHGKVLKSIYSEHDNGKEDRRWGFTCADAPGGAKPKSCYWTGYVNGWDAPMSFMCRADHVITGLQSYHDNGKEDRLFQFKCCNQPGFATRSCYTTGNVNGWDGVLSYRVPDGQVLAGVASVHDNRREDRLFQFTVCSYGKKRNCDINTIE